jgi:hypothetical protein
MSWLGKTTAGGTIDFSLDNSSGPVNFGICENITVCVCVPVDQGSLYE